MKNYNIPKTRKEKINLLKAISNGHKTIDSLKDRLFEIVMWQQDQSDPDYLITFDGLHSVSKTEHERNTLAENIIGVTLEISEKQTSTFNI